MKDHVLPILFIFVLAPAMPIGLNCVEVTEELDLVFTISKVLISIGWGLMVGMLAVDVFK